MCEQAPETATGINTALLDRVIACGLWIPEKVAELVIGNTAAEHGQTMYLEQERIGKDGEAFTIIKLRTQDGDTGIPYDPRAQLLRDCGADEAVQNRLMGRLLSPRSSRGGNTPPTMKFQSYRPLVRKEHEEFLDALDPKTRHRWLRDVQPDLPGVLSTYGILFHTGLCNATDRYQRKAEYDIQDQMDQSPLHTIKLMARLASLAASKRLKHV